MHALLLLSVFVISTCGLIYELIAGALASYLLGDSIMQFSTVIGTYLFAMGIGSYLSRYVSRNVLAVFIQVELLIGVVGGFSAAGLFLMFDHVASFRVLLYAMVMMIGALVGLEIPLLMRILQERLSFKELVAQVFTFDYVGALIASLLFPLVLVPYLGMVRSALLFGILNILVAVVMLVWIGSKRADAPAKGDVRWAGWLRGQAVIALIALICAFIFSERLVSLAEASAYPDPVVHARSTPYQRIVVTRTPGDVRLYLNGNLQFSSRDEYRYHEALVHPGLAARSPAHSVLVLGGGDGLAVRELLKHPEIERIHLVDLDPEMVRIFRDNIELARLNHGSFSDPKVTVENADAFVWVEAQKAPGMARYDFIVVDFPDPANFSIGKLYTTRFYRSLKQLLAPGGLVVIQSTSPYVARKSFWCVDSTLREAGFRTLPYHVYVPSFGDWGYLLAGLNEMVPIAERLPSGLRFLDKASLASLFVFPPDMSRVEMPPQKLNNQILVRTFEEEWAGYAH